MVYLVPQPRKRDTLLQQVRSNYQNIAKKVGDVSSYPGDWLYATWSESDLKEWLDVHGFPAPQPTTVSCPFSDKDSDCGLLTPLCSVISWLLQFAVTPVLHISSHRPSWTPHPLKLMLPTAR